MQTNYLTRFNNLKKEYPNLEVLELKFTQNAMTLWNKIKYFLSNNISAKGSKFVRNEGYSEKKMIRDMRKIINKHA